MPKTSIMTNVGLIEAKQLSVLHLGARRPVHSLRVMDGGALRLVGNFIPPLAVSISPSSVSGVGPDGYTPPVTATPTGGLGPYSYAWTTLSYTGGFAPTITAPLSATTKFLGLHNTTASFQVVVTDSLGTNSAATVAVAFI